MKSYKVRMTRPAAKDLEDISAYIANELREPAAAKKLVSKIKEAALGLGEMPTRYALVTDERLALQGIRKLMMGNYIIFYVISEEDAAVTVVRILYSRRNWAGLL